MERQRTTAAPLPNDLESAHQLIAELWNRQSSLSEELDLSTRREQILRKEFDDRESTLCAQISEDQRKIESLQQQLHWLRNHVFGRRSEKGVPDGQQALPFTTAAGEVEETASDEDRDAAIEVPAHKRRRRGGRKPLPKDLPRETIELLPADGDRYCRGCDSEKTRIGEDRTEELEYRPASFFVREYVRPRFACRKCEDGVTQAPLPARPIEKGRPGPGLLAHVVTSKYGDHLPLYRLEAMFRRHGIEIGRSTLSEWCGAVADLLKCAFRSS